MPIRNKAMRSATFEDRYDSQTVFFDIFWDRAFETVTCLAAPLLNLVEDLPFEVVALPSGHRCKVHSEEYPHFQRLLVSPPPGTVALSFESALGRVVRAIQPNLGDAFAGSRAIYTLQKDNDLLWIRDWATFYACEHGANAVIVYDNGSTRYDLAELANVLEAVNGIEQVAVVDWSYPYGAFDLREPLSLECLDGVYCQWAAFHHVWWRLAGETAGLLNADIDELVVKTAERTLFEAIEGASTGYIRISGYWVENVIRNDSLRSCIRRHADYRCLSADVKTAEPKWIMSPKSISGEAVLYTHDIFNAYPITANDFTLYHFKGINIAWDVDRLNHGPRSHESSYSSSCHTIDWDLASSLDRVFGENSADQSTRLRPSLHPEMAAHIARLRSGMALSSGKPAEALWLAREAVTLSPDMPSYREHLALLVDTPEMAREQMAKAVALREADFGFHFQKGLHAELNADYDLAIEAYQRSRALDPFQPSPLYRLLECYLALGEIESIEMLAQQAVALLPEEMTLALLVRVAERTGRWSWVETLANDAIERNSQSSGLLERYAHILLRRGCVDQAKEIVTQARDVMTPQRKREALAAVNRDSPPLHRYHYHDSATFNNTIRIESAIAAEEGRFAEAANLMREMAMRQYPAMHLEMPTADLYGRAGNEEERAAALRRVIAIARTPALSKPKLESSAQARRNYPKYTQGMLVEALIKLGDNTAAKKLLEESQQDPSVFCWIGLIAARTWLASGLLADAETTARSVLDLWKSSPQVLIVLAEILLKQGDYAGARAAAEELVNAGTEEAMSAQLMLARIEATAGDAYSAAQFFQAVLQIDPDHRQASIGVVRNLLQSGHETEALDWARRNHDRRREDPDRTIALAEALVANKRMDEALYSLEEGLKFNQDQLQLLLRYAWYLNLSNRHQEASRAAARATELAPCEPNAYQHLATALQSLGERKSAIQAWKTFLMIKPDAAMHVYLNLARLALSDGDNELAATAAQEVIRRGGNVPAEVASALETR